MTAPNPVAFTLFGIDIMWYGILIATGMVLAVVISYKRAPYHLIDQEHVLDIAIWLLPAGVIGARLYYIIFNWSYYAGDLGAMLDIRGGGLAIHGGIIAGTLSTYFVCKAKGERFFNVCDLAFPSVALAQGIGRWGNFFNGEAYGSPTDLPWAIVVDGQHVHPTFLYESLWCLALFIVLSIIDRKYRKFDGQVACLYVILYSIERFFVEWLRTDSLMIGPFKQAQVLSITAIIICTILYVKLKKQNILTQAKESK